MFPCATLDVDLGALRANYRLLKEKFAGQSVSAVVKANAYGLGVSAVSQALWQEGCRDFFVATLEEGIELRELLPSAHIGVFNGLLHEPKAYIESQLTPVLNDLGQVERWQKAATLADAILHIDTGITRLGLSEPELAALSGKQFALIMSHLACANEPSHEKNAEQLARFKKALQLFPGAKASLCNSSGIFLPNDFHFDVARPGCALYGITPVTGKNPMQHVATLSAALLQIRTLERNETIGYGATASAKKGARIALVGIGYADGYFRLLSNKGKAFVGGKEVPLVGRVSMDMVAIDVSNIPENKLANARAEFINEKQTVNDLAEACGTIGYEIFCRIGRRVQRVYR